MEEDITIIENRTKIEKINNYLKKNRKILIIVLLAITSIIFGYFILEEIKKKNKIQLSEKFNLVSVKFTIENKEHSKATLLEIINAKDKTYSPHALFFLIDKNILKNKEELNPLFDLIINETKLDKEIKNLIIYKKALVNSEFESESNLIEMLSPIINSDSIWKSHALFLLAEYFFSKNEKQKSKQFFEQIISLQSSNEEIKLEAQKRIKRDFSE